MKLVAVGVAGALAAFVVSGPLQHVGALPKTVVGDLSKQTIKSVLGLTAKDAYAACGPGVKVKGNNGFGNGGLDPAPGNSGTNGAPNAGQKTADVDR